MCLLVPSSGRVLPSQNVPILPCDRLPVSYCTLIRPVAYIGYIYIKAPLIKLLSIVVYYESDI